MPDHFGDQLGPVPALMAAADATTELKVGALVFDNDYKHPVVLAKELATIDVLSGGRLIVGIGAGWMASDYEQSGIPMDPPGVRVTRMEEGIAVLKGCFAEGPFSFTGRALHDHRLRRSPEAVAVAAAVPHRRRRQAGAVDRGTRRRRSSASTRRSTAATSTRRPPRTAPPTRPTRRSRGCARPPATRYADLEINMLQFAGIVTDDRKGTAEMMAPLFGLPPEELETYPHACIGTVDEICESLEMRRERWDASYFVFQGDTMEPLAPVVAKLAGT